YLVSRIEKGFGPAHLRDVIVLVDIDPALDLFDRARRVLLFLLLLGEVITEFSEMHDPANRRLCFRCHFDQVQALAAGQLQSGVQTHDPQLLVGDTVNDPDLPGTDAFVDADISDINGTSRLYFA